MRPALGPLHLLLLTEAPADDLVARERHKAGADALALAIALAIVGDAEAIPLNRGVERLPGFEAFACGRIARGGHRHVQVHREGSELLERCVAVAMPQGPNPTRVSLGAIRRMSRQRKEFSDDLFHT